LKTPKKIIAATLDADRPAAPNLSASIFVFAAAERTPVRHTKNGRIKERKHSDVRGLCLVVV